MLSLHYMKFYGYLQAWLAVAASLGLASVLV